MNNVVESSFKGSINGVEFEIEHLYIVVHDIIFSVEKSINNLIFSKTGFKTSISIIDEDIVKIVFEEMDRMNEKAKYDVFSSVAEDYVKFIGIATKNIIERQLNKFGDKMFNFE